MVITARSFSQTMVLMVIRASSFSKTMVLMVIRARSFSQNYGERLSKPVALVQLWWMVIRSRSFSRTIVDGHQSQ